MSILIKGMSKPKTCDDCIVPLSKCDYLQKRADDCPLVEIPTPHGRLIDGDKIGAEAEQTLYGEVSYEDIANAPTILEAEE